MSDTVIKVENVWKEYHIGVVNHHSMVKDVQSWWAQIRGKEDPNSIIKPCSSYPPLKTSQEEDRFWALRDVSFEVKRGDVLGIIGRNGAGKSTLLKIISKITKPTKGQVTYKGKIVSLLEVGTGFHPELSGRDNIFLNGAILGMTKAEIKRKFDEIVDFSGVEKFIDTPVKRYSSGMYVRLAFAVAAHLEHEILVVDEVLAVGDAEFQKKCMGKMDSAGKEGRTVLFVSHAMNAIEKLCTRAIWLNNGAIERDGDVLSITNKYLNRVVISQPILLEQIWTDEEAPGNDNIRLKSVRLISDNANDPITVKTLLKIEFIFKLLLPKASFALGIHLLSAIDDACVFVTSTTESSQPPEEIQRGLHKYTCNIPSDLLNIGKYTIVAFFVRDVNVILYKIEKPLLFEIFESKKEKWEFTGVWPGAVRPKLKWDITHI